MICQRYILPLSFLNLKSVSSTIMILQSILPVLLLPTTFALPSTLQTRADAYNPPRNQIYVQTFRNTTGGQFSMLPLIQNPTQLTHLHLAALHINAQPGDIALNDNNLNDTVWNGMWSEAAQLQQSGVKVLMMIGGAAKGSYPRLCSGPKSTVIVSEYGLESWRSQPADRGAAQNESYYQPLYYSLKAHNIDGVNLDIEEKVAYTCPLALLKRFNQDFGEWPCILSSSIRCVESRLCWLTLLGRPELHSDNGTSRL